MKERCEIISPFVWLCVKMFKDVPLSFGRTLDDVVQRVQAGVIVL